jgi:hypothetical protein
MGKWIGKPVETEWPDNLNGKIKTLTELRYIDDDGRLWLAPAGTVTDGASIPRPFWLTVGHPLSPDTIEAAIIHDVYCEHKFRPSKLVHKVFGEMLKDSPGVGFWKRKRMEFAVKVFGPKF